MCVDGGSEEVFFCVRGGARERELFALKVEDREIRCRNSEGILSTSNKGQSRKSSE